MKANTDPNITRDMLQLSLKVLLTVGTVVNIVLAGLACVSGTRSGRVCERAAPVVDRAAGGVVLPARISNVLGLVALMVAVGGLALLFFKPSTEYLTREPAL